MKVVMYTTIKNLKAYQRGEEIQVWNEDLKRKGDIQVIIDADEIILGKESEIDERFTWVNADTVAAATIERSKGFYVKKKM